MARRINSRLFVKGTLRTETALHVGGGRSSGDIDLALVRNGQGEVVIPGTSLAGPLREWMARRIPSLVDRLFGDRDVSGDSGSASRVLVDDGVVKLERTDIQAHTAINRFSGSAFDGTLHSREVIPRGSSVSLELTLEALDSDDEAAVAFLVQAMENGRVQLGAGKFRGLGDVRLTEVEIVREDWSTKAGVLTALGLSHGEARSDDPITARRLIEESSLSVLPDRILEIAVDWKPALPVMLAEAGGEVDIVPRVSLRDGKVRLELPGSSIKGALRSRAEFIVRTVLEPLPSAVRFGLHHYDQSDEPLVVDLFGQRLEDINLEDAEKKARFGRPGIVAIPGIESKTAMDVGAWDALMDAPRDGLKAPLEQLNRALDNRAQIDVAYHSAVDRFTGAAADGALYNSVEPHHFEWEPVRLRIDLDRLEATGRARALLALLMLTLRDLGDGWIRFGFGGLRGYGAVDVQTIDMDPTTIELDGREYGLGLSRDDGGWDLEDDALLEGWADTAREAKASIVGQLDD